MVSRRSTLLSPPITFADHHRTEAGEVHTRRRRTDESLYELRPRTLDTPRGKRPYRPNPLLGTRRGCRTLGAGQSGKSGVGARIPAHLANGRTAHPQAGSKAKAIGSINPPEHRAYCSAQSDSRAAALTGQIDVFKEKRSAHSRTCKPFRKRSAPTRFPLC